MTFGALNLAEPVLRAVASERYVTPSPIQRQAIPHLLAGKDVLGCAQTGTGKTAAFALPIVHALHLRRDTRRGRFPKALVLTPTRELAAQVGGCFTAFSRFSTVKTTVVFGGVGQQPQVAALRNGIDVLVATPGRLMDLLNQKLCDLRDVATLVLDEADHMLDLGFIHDVKRIIAKIPEKRQTLLFSATMPGAIAALAASVLRDPVDVSVTPVSSAVEKVAQSVYHVAKPDKGRLLGELLKDSRFRNSLVFSRTKHGADRISRMLNKQGIKAGAIHGDKTQSSRNETLAAFKNGTLRVLVATDIAARGIDIHALSHVFNYDLPEVPETYVHRIGRTGRAGLSGEAISFCDMAEQPLLRDIEKLIGIRVPVVRGHAFAAPEMIPAPQAPQAVNRLRNKAPSASGAPSHGSGRRSSPGGRPRRPFGSRDAQTRDGRSRPSAERRPSAPPNRVRAVV